MCYFFVGFSSPLKLFCFRLMYFPCSLPEKQGDIDGLCCNTCLNYRCSVLSECSAMGSNLVKQYVVCLSTLSYSFSNTSVRATGNRISPQAVLEIYSVRLESMGSLRVIFALWGVRGRAGVWWVMNERGEIRRGEMLMKTVEVKKSILLVISYVLIFFVVGLWDNLLLLESFFI